LQDASYVEEVASVDPSEVVYNLNGFTVTIERFGIRIPADRLFRARKHIIRERLIGKPIQVTFWQPFFIASFFE